MLTTPSTKSFSEKLTVVARAVIVAAAGSKVANGKPNIGNFVPGQHTGNSLASNGGGMKPGIQPAHGAGKPSVQVPLVPINALPRTPVQRPTVAPAIAASRWGKYLKWPMLAIGVAAVAYYLYQQQLTQNVVLDDGVIPTGFDAEQLVKALNYFLNQQKYDIAYEIINANRAAFNALSEQEQQDFLRLLPLEE